MNAIDHAAIGRVYADNLLGEPAVSRCLHAMADEIERLRNGGACPHVRGTVTQHCSLNFTITDAEREAISEVVDCLTETGTALANATATRNTLAALLERLA